MTVATKYQVPRGTFDILPQDSYKWDYIEHVFQEVAQSFQYKRIVTPIFEEAGLFERSVGDNSDIIQKEMYKFEDRKGRLLALRPEGTAPVVRSYVENNLGMQGNLSRMYYMGPMFRYDRPQAGRYRQFYQYGVEAIGSNHPYIDAEVIGVQYTFLKRLGLNGFRLEINSVGNPACSEAYDKALVAYFQPHQEELCPDCQQRLLKKPRRLLDCKVPKCKEIAKGAPSMFDYLDDECRQHFEQVCHYLTEMNIEFVVNHRIVRGLDYYSHTAFEFIYDALGAQNAIGGGGRYNGLVSQIGGKDAPGIGFAGGMERLLLALECEDKLPKSEQAPLCAIIALGESARMKAVSLVATLRTAGLSVEFDIEKESMKAQLKNANRVNAHYALILGEEELLAGQINVKDLAASTDVNIALPALVTYLQSLSS